MLQEYKSSKRWRISRTCVMDKITQRLSKVAMAMMMQNCNSEVGGLHNSMVLQLLNVPRGPLV